MLSIVSPFENTGHKTKLWMLLYMCVFLLQFMSEKPALPSVWIRDMCPVDARAMFVPSLVFSHLVGIHLKHNHLFSFNPIDKIIWSLSKNVIIINIYYR